MENEIWVPIRGYEDVYMVSNLGRVKSINRYYIRHGYKVFVKEVVLRSYLQNSYPAVKLCKMAKTKAFPIHRLLAIHFLSNPENKPDINHINGIKNDFRLENLEWCTHTENMRHAVKSGLIVRPSGANAYTSKRIIDNKTGEIYHSILEAATQNNIKLSTLRCYLAGHRKNKTTLRYAS